MRRLTFYTLLLLFLFVLTACTTSGPDSSSGGSQTQEQELPTDSGDTQGDETGSEADTGTANESESGSNPDTDSGQEESSDAESDEPEQDPAEATLAGMSLEEKIGQMIIGGFPGTELGSDAKTLIQEGKLGGVILFGPNISGQEQLQTLINEIKASNQKDGIPLFVSVDEEGGRVTRLPEGKTEFPSNQVIGAHGSAELSKQIGSVIGEEIAAFGFNLNFAPVLDIFSNPENTVIGTRSFGNNAEIVSDLGIATMQGMQEAGVVPAVKHFPGHGDTIVDSHVGLPVVDKTQEELNELELIPFKEAIDAGADIVMAAHIQYPNIDSSLLPASLSKVMLTGILREEMGYDGIVITDDLEMGAIQQHYGSGDAALMAIQAGADIVLFGHTPAKAEKAYDTILQAARTGELSQEQIDSKVLRIIRLKNKYELTDQPANPAALETIGSGAHQQIAEQLK
ncbi:beta-N-acetylhexosaminidase [Neobacillus mesonae]|nr:beta-N-acetylhexosaminidase [Neobacillus mesonae]